MKHNTSQRSNWLSGFPADLMMLLLVTTILGAGALFTSRQMANHAKDPESLRLVIGKRLDSATGIKKHNFLSWRGGEAFKVLGGYMASPYKAAWDKLAVSARHLPALFDINMHTPPIVRTLSSMGGQLAALCRP